MKAVFLCNPILDLVVEAENEFLSKHNLKSGGYAEFDAELHGDIYNEVQKLDHQRIPGGCGLNSARACAALLSGARSSGNGDQSGIQDQSKKENEVGFIGCLGGEREKTTADALGNVMIKIASDLGVDGRFDFSSEANTAVCAVVVEKESRERTLCTYLGASQKLSEKHVIETCQDVIKDTPFVCVTGFAVTANAAAMKQVCHQVGSSPRQNLIITLSAPFVITAYCEELLDWIAHAQIVVGNEHEWAQFAMTALPKLGLTIPQLPQLPSVDSTSTSTDTSTDGISELERAADDEAFLVATLKAIAEHTQHYAGAAQQTRAFICSRGGEPVLLATPPSPDTATLTATSTTSTTCTTTSTDMSSAEGRIFTLPGGIKGWKETGASVTAVPVRSVPKELIVDTNGCGDAFLGALVASLVQQTCPVPAPVPSSASATSNLEESKKAEEGGDATTDSSRALASAKPSSKITKDGLIKALHLATLAGSLTLMKHGCQFDFSPLLEGASNP